MKTRRLFATCLFIVLFVNATHAQDQKRQIPAPRDPTSAIEPTHSNVRYGPHERNVIDLYLADSVGFVMKQFKRARR